MIGTHCPHGHSRLYEDCAACDAQRARDRTHEDEVMAEIGRAMARYEDSATTLPPGFWLIVLVVAGAMAYALWGKL